MYLNILIFPQWRLKQEKKHLFHCQGDFNDMKNRIVAFSEQVSDEKSRSLRLECGRFYLPYFPLINAA